MRHPQDKAESKYNPDAGISKEDEERYQKLMKENEELQRLIVQVRIGEMKRKEKNSIEQSINKAINSEMSKCQILQVIYLNDVKIA